MLSLYKVIQKQSIYENIRVLKRKFNSTLYDYKDRLDRFNGFIEIYVPQINYVNEKLSSYKYQVIDFLIENTKYWIPESTNFLYVINELGNLKSRIIISEDDNDFNLNLI